MHHGGRGWGWGLRSRGARRIAILGTVILLSSTSDAPAQKPPAPATVPTAARPSPLAPQSRAGSPKPVVVTTSALTMTGLAFATRTDPLAMTGFAFETKTDPLHMTGLAVTVSTDPLVMTGTAGQPLLQQPPTVQTPPSR
jgi:hypothetical protein